MNLLIAGLVLWSAGHFFKSLAPQMRAGMDEKLGKIGGKAVMGVVLLIATVMIVNGYRAAPMEPAFDPPFWGKYLNSLLMIFAVALIGMGKSRGKMRSVLRHPMLWGVVIWAFAHLLVNGDVASVVLFGGLGIWALAEMVLINKAQGAWVRPAPGPISGDIKWLVISAVVFVVIVAVHTWIGPAPFGG